MQDTIFRNLIIETDDRTKKNNSLYEYLQKLFSLASRIEYLDMHYLSENLMRKIEKAMPKLVAVKTASIATVNFSENLQWVFLKVYVYNIEMSWILDILLWT